MTHLSANSNSSVVRVGLAEHVRCPHMDHVTPASHRTGELGYPDVLGFFDPWELSFCITVGLFRFFQKLIVRIFPLNVVHRDPFPILNRARADIDFLREFDDPTPAERGLAADRHRPREQTTVADNKSIAKLLCSLLVFSPNRGGVCFTAPPVSRTPKVETIPSGAGTPPLRSPITSIRVVLTVAWRETRSHPRSRRPSLPGPSNRDRRCSRCRAPA